jgi:hypothetical protein
MSSQLIETDECNVCMNYVKMISNGSPWKCVCCSMDEATIYIGKREGVFLWHRYELRCGHQCHERCYRKWCYYMDTVGCPLCGTLSKDTHNQYCRICKSWGHSRETCPMIRLPFYKKS